MYKFLNVFICLFFYLFLFGCKKDLSQKSKIFFGTNELTIPLMEGGIVAFPNLCTGVWEGEDVIGYYNYFEKRIELYGIESQDSVLMIPIRQEGPDAVGDIGKFYLINNKIATHCNQSFFLLDRNGAIVDKSPWSRLDSSENALVKAYRLQFTTSNNNQSSYQEQDSFFYLNFIRRDIDNSNPAYYLENPYPIVRYNYRDHSFLPVSFSYPKQVVENIHTIGYTSDGCPQVDVQGDTLVFNFQLHDEIYSLINGELYEKTIPSTFFPESDPKALNAMDKNLAFRSINRFFPVQYDPYRNLYIRFQMKVNSISTEQQPSLTVLSSSLEEIDEVLLPNDLNPIFFFRPEAIYAAVKPDYLPDENHLRFRPIYVEME